jgi:serine/threonine protein kinase
METLGTYRLISRLGAGGMGEVWRAEDTKLLRQVAIKILPEQLAGDPEWKDRFLREARMVAQLNHPNIATIYSIDQQGETLFIAMELIEGQPVSELIAEGPMKPAEAVRIASHVADGLSEAHTKGIVHRDIKPDNILVAPRFVKILDFGIAKNVSVTADASLTQGGMVIGTPHYMSPEQALGRPVDARTDVFSLGVVLYEMLTGQKPFAGDAVTEILLKIVMSEPPDIATVAPGVPPLLADVVRRCMRKQPGDRFGDCEELRRALAGALQQPVERKRNSQIPTLSTPRTTERRATPRPAAAKPAPAPAQSYRALIADDDPTTRYILGNILARHRISYDEAENGADAVKFLKNNRYGLVFLDLLMPRIDGWGVIDYLRSQRGTATLPRLFVITGVQDQKLSTADRDVVTGLLYKPIDVAKVESVVKEEKGGGGN